MKDMVKLMGFVSVVVIVVYLGWTGPMSEENDSEPETSAASPAEPAVRNPPTTTRAAEVLVYDGGLEYRGMALQITYTVDGIDRYLRAIDEIAELGADTLMLSTSGSQEHAGSMGITIDSRKSPTLDQFEQLIERARSHDMKVILMPIVLLSNPRGNQWRGAIQPPDWDEWFSSYLSFIKYFAQVARDNPVEALVIGTELVSTDSFRSRWLTIIEEVRKIYPGKLLYSANWDHYHKVSFWDQMDMIGMTTYHTLADRENPDYETLLDSWRSERRKILQWHRQIGKPIIFTEVGWCSQPGASIQPWNYYRHQKPSEEGLEEQKKLYKAFIETWRDEPSVAGTIWWEWTPQSCGPEDYGYTPKGKPAEAVLRVWFREGPTTTPDPSN